MSCFCCFLYLKKKFTTLLFVCFVFFVPFVFFLFVSFLYFVLFVLNLFCVDIFDFGLVLLVWFFLIFNLERFVAIWSYPEPFPTFPTFLTFLTFPTLSTLSTFPIFPTFPTFILLWSSLVKKWHSPSPPPRYFEHLRGNMHV